MSGESDLHSATLTPAENVPTAIAEAAAELTQAFGSRRLLRWDDTLVAIPVEVEVSMPSRGPQAAILAREPILVMFHRGEYPLRAPRVYSDRKSFPLLPHINPTSPGHPAYLCLHRGDIDAWFAEHTIVDLVGRAREWLCDAAGGNLQRDDDLWEPTRSNNDVGIAIFDHTLVEAIIAAAWRTRENRAGHSLMSVLAADFAGAEAPAEVVAAVLDPSLEEGDEFPPAEQEEKIRKTLGVVAWPPGESRFDEHLGSLPRTFGELSELARRLGVPLGEGVSVLRSRGPYRLVLIVLALRRPKPIINTTSELEFLCFFLRSIEPLSDETRVYVLDHYKPFTRQLATEVSANKQDGKRKVAILGCGALGSKISIHLARGGESDQILVDDDRLLPHNLVRHALLSGSLGRNKAEALRQEIANLYLYDSIAPSPRARSERLSTLLRTQSPLDDRTLIVDATASQAGINALAVGRHAGRVVRCELAAFGRLGILLAEGERRSPRIDDLQAQLYYEALRQPLLSVWLKRSREAHKMFRGDVAEEITLGQSCGSDTLRVSDELVTLHAAQFALALRRLPVNGRIMLTNVDPDNLIVDVKKIVVASYEEVPSNSPGWTARVEGGVLRKIRQLRKSRGRDEVGGILLGYIHMKRKVVYVTECIGPSTDSIGTATRFLRGVHRYDERLREVQEATGEVLGYVGEWHTHPTSTPEPSDQDRQSGEEIRKMLGPRMPGHIMIDSPQGTKSHLFGL